MKHLFHFFFEIELNWYKKHFFAHKTKDFSQQMLNVK